MIMKDKKLSKSLQTKLKKISKNELDHSLRAAVHLLSEIEESKDMAAKIGRIQSALMAFHAAIIFKGEK